MVTRKAIWVLFGILMISVWVLGSAIQAGAETMKCRNALTATKDERIAVNDEEGHVLSLQILQGLAFFENGEIARTRTHAINDTIPGKGGQSIAYTIYTFDDGSTIVTRNQRLMVADKPGTYSAQMPGQLIKGTGRFEGIKGTTSATGKNWLLTEQDAVRVYTDTTFTYTLPTK